MRAQRSRTKKLIVAFHFHRSNQAGWKCDECRRAGLERKRRCRWVTAGPEESGPVVWARRHVALSTCPTAYMTAESTRWLEAFYVRRALGGVPVEQLSARDAEALLLLDQELAAEINNG